MPRKTTGDKEIGLLRAAWEEIEEIEDKHRRAVTVLVTPANQKGVFVFRLSALDIASLEGDDERRSTVQQRFPNGMDQTLGGFFWSLAMSLSHLVASEEDARNRLEKQGA